MSVELMLVGAFAVWRLTHLLHAEDGPYAAFARLRQLAEGTPFAQAFDCFYCLSLWVAGPVALLIGGAPRELLVGWLALSGGAILLERVSAPMPSFQEDRALVENDNGIPQHHPTYQDPTEMEGLDVLLRKDA